MQVSDKKLTDNVIISAAELKTEFWHPENGVIADEAEQSYLRRFGDTVSTDVPDTKAYDILMGRVKAGTLSELALRVFVNASYRYWQRHLPSAEVIAVAQQMIQRCKIQWNTIAAGRVLYRVMEARRTTYYWANDPQAERASQSGVFYQCHPAFELPPDRATGKIERVRELKLSHVMETDLADQEQAEGLMRRWQQGCEDLRTISNAVQQKLPLPEGLISDYCLAQIFYQGDHLEVVLPKETAHHSAFYYFSRLMGQEALQAWRQQTSLVSVSFSQAVKDLREVIEHRRLVQACLLIRSQSLWQDPDDSGVFASVPRLLLTLSADDKDDAFRMAVRSALKRRCQLSPSTISQLTAEVFILVRAWKDYGKRDLAQAQLLFYRRALLEQVEDLTRRGRTVEVMTSLQRDITACEVLESALEKSVSTIIDRHQWPSSQWLARDEIFQQWRTETDGLWKTPAKIPSGNGQRAQRLITHLCEEIQKQLGPPQCALVVFGMGSYSRGEMGFSSDIDFGVLIAAKHSLYFKAFLDGMAYKASSFPEGILPLESKELCAIRSGECWIATPAEMIEKYCFLPDSEQSRLSDSARSLPVRWAKPLYIPNHTPAAQQLWTDYQRLLKDFYLQSGNDTTGAEGIPYYRLTEPHCLALHLKKDEVLSAGQAMSQASSGEEKNRAIPIAETVNLKAVLYPLTNAALCYARSAGLLESTETQILLEQLQTLGVIPLAFIQRLKEALADLTHWRMRLQWAHLGAEKSPPDLHGDAIYLWPTRMADQETLLKIPRGFYLDAEEVKRLNAIRVTIQAVIERSLPDYVQEFTTQRTPIASESSSITTMSSPSDSKREVFEEKISEEKISVPSEFDPLSIAIHSALTEIAALGTAAELEQNPEQQHIKFNQAIPQLEWLSSVMAVCASDLPLSPLDSLATAAIQKDALLRRHWRVYSAIPQSWRRFYMKGLRTSPFKPADGVLQTLTEAHTSNGWRLSTEEARLQWERQLLEKLTEALPAGAEAKDAIVLEWIDTAGMHRRRRLRAQDAEALFDNQGRVRPSEKAGASKRLVIPLYHENKSSSEGKQILGYAKLYPEMRGVQAEVDGFIEQISGEGCLTTLGRMTHPKQKDAIPVLFSQNAGDNLITQAQKPDTEAIWKNVDSYAFTLKVIECLLINPEDYKFDNWAFFLKRLANGESRYRFKGFDNDHAFVEPLLSNALGSTKVNVKNALYCLAEMNGALNADAITDFLILDPVHCLQAWLKKLVPLSEQALFTSAEIQTLLDNQQCFIPVAFTPGTVAQMYEKLLRIRAALQDQEAPVQTPMELLARIEPKLAWHYQQTFTPDRFTPEARFTTLKTNYEEIKDPVTKEIRYQSVYQARVSAPTMAVIRESKAIDLRKAIQHNHLCTPKHVLDHEWLYIQNYHKKIGQTLTELQQGQFTHWLRPNFSPYEREQVLKQLDFKKIPFEKQERILESLLEFSKEQVFQTLHLINAEALNDDLLKKLVNQMPELQTLSISGCIAITPLAINEALHRCRRLQVLRLGGLPQLIRVDSSLFKCVPWVSFISSTELLGIYLKILDVQGCARLQEITGLYLPHLETLIIEACSVLNKIDIHAWRLKTVRQKNCAALRPEQINNRTMLGEDKEMLKWLEQSAKNGEESALFSLVGNPYSSMGLAGMRPIEKLLWLIAEGEQAQAKALIQQDEALLLESGEVKDPAGRVFRNIKPFEYPLWAKDWHMWKMVKTHLSKKEQAKQFNKFKNQGTDHGASYDIKPLIDALQTYVDNAEKWNYDQRAVDLWCVGVGGAQRQLTVHIVNEYCREDRSFDPCPTFTEEKLPRIRISKYGLHEDWFTAKSMGMSLGTSFAFYRGGLARVLWFGGRASVRSPAPARADLKALQALWAERTKQFQSLEVELAAVLTQSQAAEFK